MNLLHLPFRQRGRDARRLTKPAGNKACFQGNASRCKRICRREWPPVNHLLTMAAIDMVNDFFT
jgi:hypothetical protein